MIDGLRMTDSLLFDGRGMCDMRMIDLTRRKINY